MMDRNSGFELPNPDNSIFSSCPASTSERAVRNPFSLLPTPVSLPALLGGLGLLGCGIPSHSTRLAAGPDPVVVRMEPAVLRSGQEAMVVVRSPMADSIAIESEIGRA